MLFCLVLLCAWHLKGPVAGSGEGRSCQDIIVVASLVDKVPNIAGLARTAEVGHAEGAAPQACARLQRSTFETLCRCLAQRRWWWPTCGL